MILLIYLCEIPKMVTVPDYDYYKSLMLFSIAGIYFFTMIIVYLIKIKEKLIDLRIKREVLKSKQELRKYLENKNKNKDESN